MIKHVPAASLPVSTVRESRLRIGPSPTASICDITNAPPGALIIVRTVDGRLVSTDQATSNGSATIDLIKFPAGIYLVEVVGSTDRVVERIVKE